jgi:hypothetical protein
MVTLVRQKRANVQALGVTSRESSGNKFLKGRTMQRTDFHVSEQGVTIIHQPSAGSPLRLSLTDDEAVRFRDLLAIRYPIETPQEPSPS